MTAMRMRPERRTRSGTSPMWSATTRPSVTPISSRARLEWSSAMSRSAIGIRLATCCPELSPAWGPAPVAAVPAAITIASSARSP